MLVSDILSILVGVNFYHLQGTNYFFIQFPVFAVRGDVQGATRKFLEEFFLKEYCALHLLTDTVTT